MSDLSLLSHQIRAEQKLFWRNPTAAMFSFALPVMFLVVFATFNSGDRLDQRGGLDFATFLVPGIVAFAIMTTTYQNIAITLTLLRDQGVLKRIRGTPLPPTVLLAARLVSATFTSFVLVTLTLVIGVLAYGVDVRAETLPGLLVTLLLGSVCFAALGVGITGLIPSADAAPAIVNALLLPLAFVSGIFFPAESAPEWLTAIAKVFPPYHLAHALQYVFDPRHAGPGFVGLDLAVLAVWTVGGILLTVFFFRWEGSK